MLLLAVVVVFAVAVAALYRYLMTQRRGAALWRSSVTIGASVGLVRGVLASMGWYVVEHTAGPLQTPAFLLSILAAPEVMVFGRQQGPAPLRFYFLLPLLLTLTSVLFVSTVALAVRLARGPDDAGNRA